jgi:hypothetical protein
MIRRISGANNANGRACGGDGTRHDDVHTPPELAQASSQRSPHAPRADDG